MPNERRLDAIETVLRREGKALPIRKIAEKAIALKLLKPNKDVNMRISVALAQAAPHSRRTRPRFVRMARVVGLGESFKRWPPTVREAVYFILKGTGQPQHYGYLTDQIAGIVPLKGNTPEMTVNASLSGDNRFVNLGAGVFGLKGMVKKFFNPNDFYFSTPKRNWEVSEKLSKLLPKTNEIVRVASPYIDKSTFETFLALIPNDVEIRLLIHEKDSRMESKVDDGLSSGFLSTWTRKRPILTRKLPDHHSRFLVIDDALAVVSSADLMKDQQQQKNQYFLSSSDPTIVKKTTKYFDTIWREGTKCNLLKEIKAIETP